jgi:peptidylprolyl isomerase
MNRLRTLSIAVTVVAGLGLAGCSSSSNSASTTTSGVTPPTTVSIGSIPAVDRSPSGTPGKEPAVVVPKSAAPKSLESADLITGTGPKAKAGDNVTVQYVLATYSSGKTIQSSWTSQPFTFTIGANQVIPGWDYGVAGMQAGGRRELIIPASLGYGASSPGPGIAPNDTLVFVIDLLKIN